MSRYTYSLFYSEMQELPMRWNWIHVEPETNDTIPQMLPESIELSFVTAADLEEAPPDFRE